MVHRLMKQWEADHPEEGRKPTKKRCKKKKSKRKIAKAWDCTTSDLSKHKLSEEEMLKKRAQHRSKHQPQARTLVKQARKKSMAKKREDMQRKKQSIMRKWDKRIKKAKKSSHTREDEDEQEASVEEDDQQEVKEEKQSNAAFVTDKSQPESSDATETDPVWEWGTSASSSMDMLDDKLLKLQKEFHQFESRVRKELREPEPIKSVPVAPAAPTQMEQLILQMQGLAGQIGALSMQVKTMDVRLTKLELEKPTQIPLFSHQPPIPEFDPIPSTLGMDLLGRSFIPRNE